MSCPTHFVEGLALEYDARNTEFFQQFLLPLLAECGGENDEDSSFALGPFLRDDNA